MKRNQKFSLIELLLVITIIGILSLMILPNYGDLGNDAGDKVAAYNAKIYANALKMYRVSNQAFPNKMHTGLDTAQTGILQELAPVIKKNLELNTISITNNLAISLRNTGIYQVIYGYNDLGTVFQNNLPLRGINKNWFTECVDANTLNTDAQKMVKFGNIPLSDLVTLGATGEVTEQFQLVPMIITKDATWGVVYDSEGNPRTMATMTLPEFKDIQEHMAVSAMKHYPVAILKVYHFRKAELLGVLIPSSDGYSLEVQE